MMPTARPSVLRVACVLSLSLGALSCGGGTPQAASPEGAASAAAEEKKLHPCGKHESEHSYDLHDDDGHHIYAPCSGEGAHDLSGFIKLETVPDGVRVRIEATDDDVNHGALGSDVKTRDAVLVYPKGPGTQAVEVHLERTAHGYKGEKTIRFDELEKLTDEGTKIAVHVYDHDDGHEHGPEELKVSVSVSAGKSCEKAQEENPQAITMGKKDARPDLTDSQLGGPMKSSEFFASCNLKDDANAEICVAVKQGKPLGVSVKVSPKNNKVAACIDKATRRLSWPTSDKLDVVKQSF